MITKQVSVFIENRPGRAAEVISAISAENINIKSMCIADTSGFGILRMIVDKPDETINKLAELDFAAGTKDVLTVSLENKPGAIAEVLNILASAGHIVEYMYSSIPFGGGSGDFIICTNRVEDAQKALDKSGII